MALTLLYDKCGLSISFKEAEENLGLKGVQLETLGFLQLRHCLEWGTYENIFKHRVIKFKKYLTKNAVELRELKHDSFKENNYE